MRRQVLIAAMMCGLCFANGVFAQTDDESKAAEQADLKRQLAERENLLAELQKKLAELQQKHAASDKLRNILTAELKRLDGISVKGAIVDERRNQDAMLKQLADDKDALIKQAEAQQRLAEKQVKQLDRYNAAARAMTELAKKAAQKQGPRHAYSEVLKRNMTMQLHDIEAALAESQEKFGSQHPRVRALKSQLATTRKFLANAESKTSDSQKEIAQLTKVAAELRKKQTMMSAKLGPKHPTIKNLEAQVQDVENQLIKLDPERSNASELSALDAAIKMLEKAKSSRTGDVLLTLRDAKSAIEARKRLSLRGANADDVRNELKKLIEKRTSQMIEMESKLEAAEAMRRKTFEEAAGASRLPGASNSKLDGRMDRLEQKVDKLTKMMERLLESKSKDSGGEQ